MTDCHDCAAGLVHCHGLLVRHADGTTECTECTMPLVVTHEFVTACGDECCIDVRRAA